MMPNRPVFPELTEAQFAVLNALTDQRCANMMEAMDFVSDLSPEAKAFLKSADKDKIQKLTDNMTFFATTKAVWRFLWIGGGVLLGFVVGLSQLWKEFGDHFTVKLK
jgi:mannose/fructose/N-acetylgalactosamine-specific phosphotransferase system component IID